MFSKILVCTDGSAHARKVAQEAALLAKQSNACVLLLHVTESPAVPLTNELCYSVPWQMERSQNDAEHDSFHQRQQILHDAEIVFRQAGVSCRTLATVGHPAAEILRVAKCEDIDLIVLGSWGFNLLKSLLLGCVSENVALHAPCSVWLVR